MQAGLAGVKITSGRLQLLASPAGWKIIDDSYNANPDSVRAALEVLRDLGGANSVAVLGDMLELGPAAPEAHREIGRFAARARIGALVTLGELGAEIAAGAAEAGLPAVACRSHAEALEAVKRALPPAGAGWYILVKGSRGMRMETIVQGLMAIPEGN